MINLLLFTNKVHICINTGAEWYQIYLASSVDKFVGGIDNSLHIVSEEGVLPGTVVNVKYDFRDYNESRAFFAVVATFRTQTVLVQFEYTYVCHVS